MGFKKLMENWDSFLNLKEEAYSDSGDWFFDVYIYARDDDNNYLGQLEMTVKYVNRFINPALKKQNKPPDNLEEIEQYLEFGTYTVIQGSAPYGSRWDMNFDAPRRWLRENSDDLIADLAHSGYNPKWYWVSTDPFNRDKNRRVSDFF